MFFKKGYQYGRIAGSDQHRQISGNGDDVVVKRQEYIDLFSSADLSALSPRQKECVENLLSGMNVTEIAKTIGTSKQNVSQALKGAENNIKQRKQICGKQKGNRGIDYRTAEFPEYEERIKTLTSDELVVYAYRACGYTNAEIGKKIGKKEKTISSLVSNARCRLQGKEQPHTKWSRNNREKFLKDMEKWRKQNPEKCRKWAKEWRARNIERDKRNKHEYYMRNREGILEKRKKYYEENKEGILEKQKGERQKMKQQKKSVEPG